MKIKDMSESNHKGHQKRKGKVKKRATLFEGIGNENLNLVKLGICGRLPYTGDDDMECKCFEYDGLDFNGCVQYQSYDKYFVSDDHTLMQHLDLSISAWRGMYDSGCEEDYKTRRERKLYEPMLLDVLQRVKQFIQQLLKQHQSSNVIAWYESEDEFIVLSKNSFVLITCWTNFEFAPSFHLSCSTHYMNEHSVKELRSFVVQYKTDKAWVMYVGTGMNMMEESEVARVKNFLHTARRGDSRVARLIKNIDPPPSSLVQLPDKGMSKPQPQLQMCICMRCQGWIV